MSGGWGLGTTHPGAGTLELALPGTFGLGKTHPMDTAELAACQGFPRSGRTPARGSTTMMTERIDHV